MLIRNTPTVFLLTLLTFLVVQGFFADSFKVYLVLTGLMLAVLLFLTRKVFFSLLTLFIILSQFIAPGKYYSFTSIEINQVKFEPIHTEGAIDAYGVITSDILAIAVMSFFVLDWWRSYRAKKPSMIGRLWSLTPVKFFTVCWSVYFCFSWFSSTQFSFHTLFSLVHLFQYLKIVPMFYGVTYLLFYEKKLIPQLMSVVITIIIFNGTLALQQFFMSSVLDRSQMLNTIQYVPEENLFFSRATGGFLFTNQLGFITSLCLLWVLPYVLKKKEWWAYLAVFLGITAIILSQSRTVLITMVIFFIIFLRSYRQILVQYIQSLPRPLLKIGVVILLLTPLILLQRVTLSRFSFEGGSADIRQRMITEGLLVLQELPWTGFGVHTNVNVMLQHMPDGYIQDFPYDVHLGYLQMALESGVIAAVAFFLPWVWVCRSWFVERKNKQPIPFVLFCSRFCALVVVIYYLFQPYAGRVEFSFLGIALAFIVFAEHNRKLLYV